MSEEKEIIPESTAPVQPHPVSDRAAQRSPLRKIGCAAGVVIWVFILLIPCIFITLAVRYEITVDTGSAPDQRLRLWLIMESGQRGIGFSNASVQETDGQTCVQTDVHFFLWQGSADPVSFCQCYRRTPENWSLVDSDPGICTPAP